ncbi:MAG: GMC family oxidoreductase N-terminal domain-containing protein [Pseudomonadota bacterium]|uniref:GMC family oxidoreductase N-terminal domain-containing protein n=1 Tax=Acinetobacter bereziniae TaxID=106648 RepID=A0A8I1AL90_ACIBZ|nr:GMC family oxidoreductase N-terminal domain-containing protein [Acinetobacter bereziniae]MBJ9949155.1 GMC family oxidoreductase N-terminal domain-containing protein [Acinetobacter bereziniae]MEC8124813.1 GMC family oxidoreductase N-terminal domain-containing protein [Pseudomonadota bacterium]QQC84423.1 GMC family oxidoreductase N-terminal domain-containing protein [Acinetobacter bereziniae]UUN97613.1 GMC family oxidoreductase N-terminal domain-containing protein [Acinetobacter bereziniae]
MNKQEFDYIIVGGGSSGCVLAGRLSENPQVSVCLLEAGGTGDGWKVEVPCAAVISIPTKINNWAFETVPQKGLNGRKGYQPRGKCLGGSSAINAMVYIRGHRQDYDDWSALGNTGWSYDEVLPYFIKSENNQRIKNQYHGNDGPLSVIDLHSDNPLQQKYLAAAKQQGYRILDDFNGEEQEGLGIYQVTHINGERCSSARAYLFSHLKRKNLTVETSAQTQRILIENGVAVGVEYKQNGQLKQIHARREVLLSAGAMQSPQILMLSGIGDQHELMEHGIEVKKHLPGVGKNFHDHPDFIFGYKVREIQGTFGLSIPGSIDLIKQIGRYRKERRGLLTTNFAECGGFIKSSAEQKVPNLQLHFVIALVDNHARTLHTGHGISCHVCLLNPKSRGTIKISGPSIDDPILIDPNFYGEESDLEEMVKGFKLTQTLMQSEAFKSMIKEDLFTANVHTDEEIRQVLRDRSDTVYHPVGSCKMGVDEMAVVDPRLRVYGIQNLRVVDASIMPKVVNGNTNAPAIMIAEKAVDMINQDQSGVAFIEEKMVD